MSSVLILGSGARENALAWKIEQSSKVGQVFVCPGNAGTDNVSGTIKSTVINVKCHKDVVDWCTSNKIQLVVIGPEEYLVNGLSDALKAAGIPCFGPSSMAACIESSKAFAKDLMTRCNIPTAKWSSFENSQEACNFINNADFPALVVKASGLAAGKGVIVAKNKEEACNAVKEMLEMKVFGSAGGTVVVEELLEGEEISCLAFCDGKTFVCMPPSQDHKRLLEQDEGPNTGGMGAYCPVSKVSQDVLNEINDKVMSPTLQALADCGSPFIGVLYAGIMLTPHGPKVLEFNCRFGDPETQAILPLLKSDLYEIMMSCVHGDLHSLNVEFEVNKYVLGIVLASEGYPGNIKKNIPIKNIEVALEIPDVQVFQAGTSRDESGQIVTSGGRVMTAVATADSLEAAYLSARRAAEAIQFQGKQFRNDIGWRSLSLRPSLTYKDSGVDIIVGDEFVDDIKLLASSTNRPGVVGGIGSFGAVFDMERAGFLDYWHIPVVRGVGSKLEVAQVVGKHQSIGTDLVAMCVNDILCLGGEPLLFLDYFACGKLSKEVAVPIIRGISEGCKLAGCALVGGETAEMPGMYDEAVYDMAGFVMGAVEKSKELPSRLDKVCEGDVVIGIASSGLHCSGFDLVQTILDYAGIKYNDTYPCDKNKTVGDCLLTPTSIYVKSLLPLIKQGNLIKAVAHITGGGLPGNVERVVPDNLAVHLDALRWNITPVFSWLQALGNVSEDEMLRTFNCGLGMVLLVSPSNVEFVLNELKSKNVDAYQVGCVTVRKESQRNVTVTNLSSLMKTFDLNVQPKVQKKKVAVLISGSGTNLQALIDAANKFDTPYHVDLVISNVASAYGLKRAELAGITTKVIEHKNFKNRTAFDTEVHKCLVDHDIDFVCLAGFMRILSDVLVSNWKGKMLNIHPSLLPSFRGLNVHKSVLEAGVKISGCTVHFVSNELDGGAIVIQEAVPVMPGDSEHDLCERVKTAEHKAFPEALRLLASGKVSLGENGKTIWM